MFLSRKFLVERFAEVVFLLEEGNCAAACAPEDDFGEETVHGHEEGTEAEHYAEVAPLLGGIEKVLLGDVVGPDYEIGTGYGAGEGADLEG